MQCFSIFKNLCNNELNCLNIGRKNQVCLYFYACHIDFGSFCLLFCMYIGRQMLICKIAKYWTFRKILDSVEESSLVKKNNHFFNFIRMQNLGIIRGFTLDPQNLYEVIGVRCTFRSFVCPAHFLAVVEIRKFFKHINIL